MALTTTNEFTTSYAKPRQNVATFWQRMGTALAKYQRARARLDQIEQLEAMSDAELAAHGLTRDTIVMYVFRDSAWI